MINGMDDIDGGVVKSIDSSPNFKMDQKTTLAATATTAATAAATADKAAATVAVALETGGVNVAGRDLLVEAAANGEVLSVADMLMEWGRMTLNLMELNYKMYIIVNNDLKMGKGKLCAQVGHAVAAWTRRLEKSPTDAYHKWLRHLEPKIVLKGDQTIITDLRKKYPHQTEIVIDAGKTQIAPGSLTVLAFAPTHIQNAPPELKNLKLL
jgi:peptidyl-tRNA hydrolase, PTH2 family